MKVPTKLTWFVQYLGIFFVIPIIGTLAHELGHAFVSGCIYQVPTHISYAFTYYFGDLTDPQIFWFIMGGPISTWLTAALGLTIILWKYRPMHSELTRTIGWGQTISVVAVSFSVRFIFNAGGYLILTTFLGHASNADEVKIANYLGVSPDLIMYGSALIALAIILLAIYFIPRQQRYILLAAGIVGGILGYLFWYYWAGPLILP